MKRIRIVLMFLVGALTLSVTASASAIEAKNEINPEYGECLKAVPVNTGSYAAATCVQKDGPVKDGAYEWHPGAKVKTFTSHGLTATLESEEPTGSKKYSKITCKEVNNTGEIIGTTEDKTTITFTGCESVTFKVKCQNVGSPEGTIVTALDSKLSILESKGGTTTEALKLKIGNDLTPDPTTTVFKSFEEKFGPGPYMAAFECGGGGTGAGAPIFVKGSVIGEQTVLDKMEATFTQTFTEVKTEQKWAHDINLKGEAEPEDTLEATNLATSSTSESGQTAKATITNGAPVEIRGYEDAKESP